MVEVKFDALIDRMHELCRLEDANTCAPNSRWIDEVHDALGQLAAAIQEEVRTAEKSVEMVGDINPDFQGAPVAERHVHATRKQLIKLGEETHKLRADIRHTGGQEAIDSAQIRRRVQEICDGIEKVRHAENDFLQATLNSNPGAGD